MAVHRHLGLGFLEAVYQEALSYEFASQEIPFERECPLPIQYKGIPLKTLYRVDFVCYGNILVEVKAIGGITKIEAAQVLNYLKASGLEKALILNFGTPSLEYKRMIFSHDRFKF